MMAVILALALPSFAATPSEFYLAMLQKGVAAHDAGRFDAAANPLRIAAFGFVDSIEHYELAQIYLTLTYDRLGEVELARRAARSTVTAERIEARYASLQVPAATRTAFETAAKRLLTPSDFATFERRATPSSPTVQVPPPAQNPTPAQTTPVNPPAAKPQTPATTQPQTTQPQTTQPNTTRPSNPQPQVTQPQTSTTQPQTSTTQPQTPPRTTTTTPAPQTTTPKNGTTTTKPAPPKPTPTQTATPAKPAPINVASRFIAAEQALTGARLADARTIYREILDQSSLQRDELLRLAEGFYRARDFAHALRTFDRLGTLRRGEEPYRYYIAVSYYETGQYARAKQELGAVLPFIEITPDVARYRTKIEGAVN